MTTASLKRRLLLCVGGLALALLLAGAAWALETRALSGMDRMFHPVPGDATWKGNWRFSDLGADPSEAGSQDGSDRVTIPFSGTGLALKVRRGDYRAYLRVRIDGRPAPLLPDDETGAYLSLTAPDLAPQIVTIPVARGLEPGAHTATVIAERGWSQWPLVGWVTRRAPDVTGYRWARRGGLALALVFLIGAIVQLERLARSTEPTASQAKPVPQGWPRPDANVVLLLALVAVGVFYLSPWLPLTGLAGVALAGLILLRLEVGLALVALAVPFYLYPRPLLGKSFSLVEVVTLLCLGAWALRWSLAWIGDARADQETRLAYLVQRGRGVIGSLSGLDLSVIFFVLVAAGSLLVADHRHVALRELRVVILEPALFYFMLRTGGLDEKAIWRVVDLFVLSGVVVAAIGLTQYALNVNVITAEQGFRRVRSVYGSPNSVGLYLGRVLPVAMAVTLFGRRRSRRVAYGLAILPVGLAALLSFSKGTILLGVPLALLAMGLLKGGRWRWVAIGAVVVGAIAAIPLLRTPRFASLFDPHRGTTFFRLQLWRASWDMALDHPWLGVGLDNFLYHYRGRYLRPAAWQEPHISQAHNLLLDYATRLGVVGLVALVWQQVAFWRAAWPLRRTADPDRQALAIGLMGAMVDTLAHGLVDASVFLIDLAFASFLALGVVQWLARCERSEAYE